MAIDEIADVNCVNCRIGSLETGTVYTFMYVKVNCRIGSLEMWLESNKSMNEVNCRIGSLENGHQAYS